MIGALSHTKLSCFPVGLLVRMGPLPRMFYQRLIKFLEGLKPHKPRLKVRHTKGERTTSSITMWLTKSMHRTPLELVQVAGVTPKQGPGRSLGDAVSTYNVFVFCSLATGFKNNPFFHNSN